MSKAFKQNLFLFYPRFGETSAHIARECAESFHVALGLVKHSPYKAPMDRRIRQLTEAGLIRKWTRDYMDRAGHLSAE